MYPFAAHIFTFLLYFYLQDYKPEEDPALFHSPKTGRGPLGPDWKVLYMNNELMSSFINLLTAVVDQLCFLLFFFLRQNDLKPDCPYMCAYKLVTVKFRWWGLQTKVENFIHRVL